MTPLERALDWNKKNYDKFRLSNVYNQARRRAEVLGLPFTITTEWLYNKALTIGKCEVTGIDFDHSSPKIKGKSNPFSASIDRIIPEKGYTKDNCRVVCWIHNRAKGDGDISDLYYYCKALVKAIEGE